VPDPSPAPTSHKRSDPRGARSEDKRGILQKLAELLHPGTDPTDELIATLS